VEMTNALPPGELSAHGNFGPRNAHNFKETHVSGSCVLQRANLGAFPSISGNLSSEDEFRGVLENIAISGWTDVPDFHVKSASHTVHLHAPFRAIVNGTNGNVQLESVKTRIDKTILDVSGSIAPQNGNRRKITSLSFSVENGRIEDVLDLFVGSPQPPLRGVTNLRGHAIVEDFGRSFLKNARLNGTFEIIDATFSTRHIQQSVDSLSARSLGAKQQDPAAAPTVQADFHGKIDMRDGKARFSGLSMSVPGAAAQMDGVYNLLNGRINFHGTLNTKVEISKTTSGLKSILLLPLDPIFKKKRAGAVIPVQMVGTYNQPQFGIDLTGGHHQRGSSAQ
jgi:hypothetical protein